MRKGKPMISTQPALVLVLAPAAVALGVSAVYASLRPRPVIAELFLYIGLWLALPVLGVRLSYLAATAGYPPRDKLFSAVDASARSTRRSGSAGSNGSHSSAGIPGSRRRSGSPTIAISGNPSRRSRSLPCGGRRGATARC